MDGCATSDQPTILDTGSGTDRAARLPSDVDSQFTSSMPSVVVISNDGDGNINHNGDGPSAKRLLVETVNADGQAYVITLHDDSAMYRAMPVTADDTCREGDDVKSREVDNVSQTWFTSREDKTNFENKGHIWKQGMWSRDEVELLESNISKYCAENNIVEPAAVIFEMSKDERKDFYRMVAKGLNRPLFSVYRRVIRMYDNKNHIGKYTNEEMKKLKDLRIQYGNNWQIIGHELGRSASSIKDKCRLMKDNCNTGKWFPCEEDRLAEAVYELSRAVPGEIVTTGISWASVAEKVATRSEKQCRTKWLNYLNWKQVGGSDWTRDDDVELITKVCSLAAKDENEVDWVGLSEGWGSVRSPQWLRGKWWNLKRPLSTSNDFSFKEICSQLFASHVINVHKKVEKSNGVVEDGDNNNRDEDDDEELVVHGLSTDIGVPMNLTETVGMISAPSILHVKHDGHHQILNELKLEHQPMFELIQPGGGTPSTFFITHNPTSSVPIASCTSTSTGQIIIQTISAEAFQNVNNLTMQMNMPSQIIISSNPSVVAPGVATFTTPTTIQFAGTIDDKDQVRCYPPHDDLLVHNLELRQMNGNVIAEDGCALQSSRLSIGTAPFDHRSGELACCECTSSSNDGDLGLDDKKTLHLISESDTSHSASSEFMTAMSEVDETVEEDEDVIEGT